jgi:hypothetical protein
LILLDIDGLSVASKKEVEMELLYGLVAQVAVAAASAAEVNESAFEAAMPSCFPLSGAIGVGAIWEHSRAAIAAA